jgi:hypothetical protein
MRGFEGYRSVHIESVHIESSLSLSLFLSLVDRKAHRAHLPGAAARHWQWWQRQRYHCCSACGESAQYWTLGRRSHRCAGGDAGEGSWDEYQRPCTGISCSPGPAASHSSSLGLHLAEVNGGRPASEPLCVVTAGHPSAAMAAPEPSQSGGPVGEPGPAAGPAAFSGDDSSGLATCGHCGGRSDWSASQSVAGPAWPAGPAGPMLVERMVHRVFDSHGRCWQRVSYHRPLTPAEYDARCAAAAAAGRPASLRWALGDERCGAELLVGLTADRRATLARLRGSRRGRVALGELAAEVRRRFAPRIAAARAAAEACPETAAWARRLKERPWSPGQALEPANSDGGSGALVRGLAQAALTARGRPQAATMVACEGEGNPDAASDEGTPGHAHHGGSSVDSEERHADGAGVGWRGSNSGLGQ